MSPDSERPNPSIGSQSQSAQDQAREPYAAPPTPRVQAHPPGQAFPQARAYPQAQAYPQRQAHPQLMVAPKNPGIALLVSFFIPGLGSMINGRVGIGVTILLVYIVGAILSLVLIGIPIAIGAWIWGMVDGYKSAQSWNLAHGIAS